MNMAIGIILLIASLVMVYADQRPHILFIVADDLGWNDVGFRNPDIISPNIDYLAKNGMILNQSYVQPVCTPSRNAFLSGFYPFKSGLQHGALIDIQPACAPLNRTFLPQKLKELGYVTHMIGKWHLGMCNWNCTPTYRGFDTFYGFYSGKEDYYNYSIHTGNDFRDNTKPIKPNGYSTFVYARRADQIISSHDKNKPMFLYLPFQSVHNPIQVPQHYEDMYKNINNTGRRQYSGMVTAMDDAIGNVTESLKRNGMFNNTLIIFTSDNGGWPKFYGNNYPLRGSKVTVYEGGTRASAFVFGAGLKKHNAVFNGLMHAVDWMPTIIAAAGGGEVAGIDGMNHWDTLRSGKDTTERKEFIYNLDTSLDPVNGHAAIRVGNYKLIEGKAGPYNDWYPVPTSEEDEKVEDKADTPSYYQLYDVINDPNERHNLHLQLKYIEIFKQLKERLDYYKKYIVPPVTDKINPASYPSHFGGYWSPGWC